MVERDLLHEYMEGWKRADLEAILNSLTGDCLIIESHGPTYRGKKAVSNWFEQWHGAGNRVLSWEMRSFDLLQERFFAQWSFAYSDGVQGEEFEGITVGAFCDNKLCYLKEYRTIIF